MSKCSLVENVSIVLYKQKSKIAVTYIKAQFHISSESMTSTTIMCPSEPFLLCCHW